jgi:hypothetical protein
VTAHPRMTRAQWEQAYHDAWKLYYTPEHMERLLRRAGATEIGVSRIASMLFAFSCALEIEKLHPLQVGILRLKYRTDRRPGFPVESVLTFYPRIIAETLIKHIKYLKKYIFLERLRRKIRRDPARWAYWDPALAPVTDGDTETLELFTHNEGARSAVLHARRIKEITKSKVPVP